MKTRLWTGAAGSGFFSPARGIFAHEGLGFSGVGVGVRGEGVEGREWGFRRRWRDCEVLGLSLGFFSRGIGTGGPITGRIERFGPVRYLKSGWFSSVRRVLRVSRRSGLFRGGS